jgi:hypothetical protein
MIFFISKIKLYDEVFSNIKEALGTLQNKYDGLGIVFIWSSEEGKIFWDIYKDMIKIVIPIENNYPKEVILAKNKKVIRNYYTIYLKL